MKQFLITIAGVFAGLLLFFVGVPLTLIGMAVSGSASPIPSKAVLELDLRGHLTDQGAHNALLGFGQDGSSVMSIVEALDRAEKDGRIKGLFVRLPEGGLEPAMADELRQAILRFRSAGKPVIAHSQGIYPSGLPTGGYMLGAAADEFWMQPGASLQATGVAAGDVFLKRFFDKYGVVADYEQRAEYKTAVNGYLQSDYTPAHKESTLSWLTSVYQSQLAAAAADRRTQPAVLRARLEAGPYSAEAAKQLGLIDRLGQAREAEASLLERAGSNAELITLSAYAESKRPRDGVGDAIAVIEAEGAIVTGRDGGGAPWTTGSAIYSDDVAEALLDAAETDSVKAIVLRLNSPGGSDTASDQILDAVRVAKAKGKPVVVSMGSYGASGGYWMASQASAIVAQPTTLTGSIGVFGGKIALGPALARYGVDLRETTVGGAYAGGFSMAEGFTPPQRAAFARWMDDIYASFIQRVSTGRGLPPERVREIAKGRVWTGAQAKTLGLVDELGGFHEAVEKAQALANLSGEPHLKRMTPSEGPLQTLQRALGISATSAKTLAAAAWVMGDPRAESILNAMINVRLRAEGRGTTLADRPF